MHLWSRSTILLLLAVLLALGPGRSLWAGPRPAAGPETVIILDPGHGGDDTGVVGPSGLAERDLALDLAERIKLRIDRRLGYPTFLTRRGDENPDPTERAARADNHVGALYIGIHLGGVPDQSIQGFSLYTLEAEGQDPAVSGEGSLSPWQDQQLPHLEESGRLAQALHRALVRELPASRDLGVHSLPVHPLEALAMPAVLIEPAVLTNPAEEGRLRQEGFRDHLAEAVFQGILLFLQPESEREPHE